MTKPQRKRSPIPLCHGKVSIPALLCVAVLTVIVIILFLRSYPSPPPRPPRPVPPAAPPTVPPTPDVILSPTNRMQPGTAPTTLVWYRHEQARQVSLAGSWNRWRDTLPMKRSGGLWHVDLAFLKLKPGCYQFKFLPDGVWEPGANRELTVNFDGRLERPSDIILTALLEQPDRVDVFLARNIPPSPDIRVQILPDVNIREHRWSGHADQDKYRGYTLRGDVIVFHFDESVYREHLSQTDTLAVAGTFNGWNPGARHGAWQLRDPEGDGQWELAAAIGSLQPSQDPAGWAFKFVVNGSRWLDPPLQAPNLRTDSKGHRNLYLDPSHSPGYALQIFTDTPLTLSNRYTVVIEGLSPRPAWRVITPGTLLTTMVNDRPLGARMYPDRGKTCFSLFAPRATSVDLCLFDTPYRTPGAPVKPRQVVALSPDGLSGNWSAEVPALPPGSAYGFRLDGPSAPGEGFEPDTVFGDPYARAVAHSHNHTLVIDPAATNEWFGGWTDHDWRPPAWEDAILYELHVRDLTADASSGVPEALRGKFEGILASQGTGTGLDHLKALGVNMIELLPIAEYENGENRYDWGYASAFFFAPESSYGRKPEAGSSYYEFKRLVNELHARGIGVVLDVVYNHIGSPNVFNLIDRKYYFRLGPDFEWTNLTGCGNDVRTEAPMMRRLIVDNVLYWMREFHVDGFRFDLAELIDMETLIAVRDAARAINPGVLLISEPWSRRGENKHRLTGTGWSAWNNDFRDTVKHFVRGQGDREAMKRAITGSVDTWTSHPRQSVNYLESHDDMSLADELAMNPQNDGRVVTEESAARHRLAATVLFTSLGIPMLAEGQDFIRSKHGYHNTFDRGDAINALHWGDRLRPAANVTLRYYRDLIRLRQSPAGAVFRKRDDVSRRHYQWIEPAEPAALGYLVNADRSAGNVALVVLLNASPAPVTFDVPFPAGRWRAIGDGRRIVFGAATGGDITTNATGPQPISVPALCSFILISEG